MNKPVLAIMAAGLGSRYGGLKQIAPVDDNKHIIIDYSIYDAHRAGFDTVVFIITRALEKDFREVIGDRISKHMEVKYAYQELDALPAGFCVPEGRIKPWGTAHAVLAAKNLIDSPFAVINADDFYGRSAFAKIYDFLSSKPDERTHAMVGFSIENTLTENGHVARGICKVDDNDNLVEIIEHVHIKAGPDGAAFSGDNDKNRTFLPTGTTVSMNMWGFSQSIMDEIENRFASFLSENLPENSLKCEYFLPFVPNELLREGKATIKVLRTPDKWYGVTYPADMPAVKSAIIKMKSEDIYPEYLW